MTPPNLPYTLVCDSKGSGPGLFFLSHRLAVLPLSSPRPSVVWNCLGFSPSLCRLPSVCAPDSS